VVRHCLLSHRYFGVVVRRGIAQQLIVDLTVCLLRSLQDLIVVARPVVLFARLCG